MGIGFRLKELLRDRKLTIKQLSEDAGIPLNTLYSITKRDSERVDPVILRRIADALDIPPAALTGGGLPVREKLPAWRSDKGSRLYMCIDTDLLRLLAFFAQEDGLSLEDEVEALLHGEVENRMEGGPGRTEDVTGA